MLSTLSCPRQVALQKEEPFAVRAAALRFLAVAMTVSSSEAAQEAQHTHIIPQGSVPIVHPRVFSNPASPDKPSLPSAAPALLHVRDPAVLTEAALARLACASPSDDLTQHRDSRSQQAVTVQAHSLAGPLCLQSDFAARQYTQGIWDFGTEQLLQASSFWEQLLDLLQVL